MVGIYTDDRRHQSRIPTIYTAAIVNIHLHAYSIMCSVYTYMSYRPNIIGKKLRNQKIAFEIIMLTQNIQRGNIINNIMFLIYYT